MEKKNHTWGKWMYWFIFAVAVIIVYKTLDNFSDIKVGDIIESYEMVEVER